MEWLHEYLFWSEGESLWQLPRCKLVNLLAFSTPEKIYQCKKNTDISRFAVTGNDLVMALTSGSFVIKELDNGVLCMDIQILLKQLMQKAVFYSVALETTF